MAVLALAAPAGASTLYVSDFQGLRDPSGSSFSSVLKYTSADIANGTYEVLLASGAGSLLGNPAGLAYGADGYLYVANDARGIPTPTPSSILRVNPSTGAATTVATLNSVPGWITFGPDGALYVAEPFAAQVVRVGARVTTYVNTLSGYSPQGIAFDSAGRLYVANYGSASAPGEITRYATDGSLDATVALDYPTGLTIGPDGNVYVGSYVGGGEVAVYSPATLQGSPYGSLTWANDVQFGPNGVLYGTSWTSTSPADASYAVYSVTPAATQPVNLIHGGSIFGQFYFVFDGAAVNGPVPEPGAAALAAIALVAFALARCRA